MENMTIGQRLSGQKVTVMVTGNNLIGALMANQ